MISDRSFQSVNKGRKVRSNISPPNQHEGMNIDSKSPNCENSYEMNNTNLNLEIVHEDRYDSKLSHPDNPKKMARKMSMNEEKEVNLIMPQHKRHDTKKLEDTIGGHNSSTGSISRYSKQKYTDLKKQKGGQHKFDQSGFMEKVMEKVTEKLDEFEKKLPKMAAMNVSHTASPTANYQTTLN